MNQIRLHRSEQSAHVTFTNVATVSSGSTDLDHHLPPAEELLHLFRDLVVAADGILAVAAPARLVLLELQMRHGSVDAANLTVRPALHTVAAAEALQSRDRNGHRLGERERRHSQEGAAGYESEVKPSIHMDKLRGRHSHDMIRSKSRNNQE